MSYIPNDENIYKEGSTVSAKTAPGIKLVIMKYYQRIYYCAVEGSPELKPLAYFERELVAPASLIG
jgi:hypothetical protein